MADEALGQPARIVVGESGGIGPRERCANHAGGQKGLADGVSGTLAAERVEAHGGGAAGHCAVFDQRSQQTWIGRYGRRWRLQGLRYPSGDQTAACEEPVCCVSYCDEGCFTFAKRKQEEPAVGHGLDPAGFGLGVSG